MEARRRSRPERVLGRSEFVTVLLEETGKKRPPPSLSERIVKTQQIISKCCKGRVQSLRIYRADVRQGCFPRLVPTSPDNWSTNLVFPVWRSPRTWDYQPSGCRKSLQARQVTDVDHVPDFPPDRSCIRHGGRWLVPDRTFFRPHPILRLLLDQERVSVAATFSKKASITASVNFSSDIWASTLMTFTLSGKAEMASMKPAFASGSYMGPSTRS